MNLVIDIYKFIGKKDITYELDQKLNANCPAEEKQGTGPGSCGGNSDKKSSATKKQKIVDTPKIDPPKEFKSTSGNKKATVITHPSGLWTIVTDDNKNSVIFKEALFPGKHRQAAEREGETYTTKDYRKKLDDPEEGMSYTYGRQIRAKHLKLVSDYKKKHGGKL